MFRPSLESLERREVFSGTDTLPMESMSLNVAGTGEVASAVPSGAYDVNVGSQLAADFDGDSDVDGADFAVGQAVRDPRHAVQSGVDTTSIGLNSDFGIGIDHAAIDHAVGQSGFMSRLLPYMEQDNLYKLRSSIIGDSALDDTAHRACDAAFAELPRGILLDPEARGNIVDGTSNTIMFAESRTAGSRSCVTDLILDPFSSSWMSGRRG
jgi:hypothetical protein